MYDSQSKRKFRTTNNAERFKLVSKGPNFLFLAKSKSICFQQFKITLPKGQLAGSEIMVKCFSNGNKKKEIAKNICKRPKNKTPFRVSNNSRPPSWTSDLKEEPNTNTEQEGKEEEEGEEYDFTYEDESELASEIFYEDEK